MQELLFSKYFGLVYAIFIYPSLVVGQFQSTLLMDRQDDLIKEYNIKSITGWECKIDNVENRIQLFSQEFDEKGNKTKEIEYETNGSICYTQTFIYSVKGKLLEYAFLSKTMDDVQKYSYDKEGREKQVLTYMKGNFFCKFVSEYDSVGNKVGKFRYDENEKMDKRFVYEYNRTGRLIEEVSYDSRGKILERIIYDYNEAGRLLEKIIFDREDKKKAAFKYAYDSKDDMVKFWGFTSHGGFTYVYGHEYDGDGNKIYEDTHFHSKILFWIIDNMVSKSIYEYSGSGKIKKWIQYKGKDDIDAIFEYGEYGLVERITRFKQGKPEAYIIYEYEFYS